MFRRVFSLVCLAVAFTAVSLPAAAQSQGPSRGYIVGLGGVGATEVNSGLFGASVGFNLTPDLQVTADLSRTQDVLASFTKEDLKLVDSGLTAATGLPFTSSVKMPTNFYLAGLRYVLPIRGSVRPYMSAGGGVAHMSPAPKFAVAGIDATTDVMDDPYVKAVFREDTRPAFTAAGGVSIAPIRHLTFDLGYRYSGIFIKTDYLQDYETSPHNHNRIDTHKIYAGVGYAF